MEFTLTGFKVTGYNLVLPNVMSQNRIYSYRIGYLGIEFNLTEFVLLGCDLVLSNLES